MREQAGVENKNESEDLMTNTERINSAAYILQFKDIKERYEKNKNYRAEIDQCLDLASRTGNAEKLAGIFGELKKIMINKLGCREEWFSDASLLEIEKAHIKQAESLDNPKKQIKWN